MPSLAAVVLAAGKGTRMKSKLPKVMHPLAGKPLIDHVLAALEPLGIKEPLVIVGHGKEVLVPHLAGRAVCAVQEEQLGTGHALKQALPFLEGAEDVLVLSGDQPLFRSRTLADLIRFHQTRGAAATVLTAEPADPYGYGRIIRDGEILLDIVEEKDASPSQRTVREINTGTYCFKVKPMRAALAALRPENAQGEYYLPGVFAAFRRENEAVFIQRAADSNEALGINSRAQLAEAEGVYRQRILAHWLEQGVTIVDPASTFVDAGVELAQDVTLLPFTVLKGNTKVAEDAVLGPQVFLESCICARGCRVAHTVAKDALIGEDSTVGPFAYLRPGTRLASGVKVGDFVEIKNSRIGRGSKVPHLSYVGDADIGAGVNIGAGTITCNYDGVNKHPTVVGDRAFIGSNTNLVAPVTVGEGAFVGAGSTITKDVPANALAVERARQTVKENWQRESCD
ncbi:glycerol-3-phosphate 1-O-acyltransferase/UDP-N-acetylglucosamine diphosphorylase/glucosamine-1-phosphate N-acetyltransferase [Acididesulfobacillus acetoxydans]|uniref:Bifunctional protein GlmU n=1 Tax=Acididesulfobacillus acetoxydans TaxID=1561005 RepID=A0A8S0WVV4_9FIRM|nr:bifunctional UDP-N-acetylglucosamine diphosphorylase/glucosamine-1-phosphate N-acetyltransferase GlmU [Acididesulfobacillus acetoxydans]CAA7599891.1 glycerol-3-phosphate 1-O-acyltransferase/UDP-N-acetylglucosamine diphosphorylase/glucosamine-1-phosphate N-acetyltransferase [Acididesulfobacillus acetoxydans]CEJ08965.1 Bifunctional protein GlmU [Acididesulfobacillus acetoxydans]